MSTVSYDDFAKLDIRVAKIIATEPIEGKTRIIKGQIDLGGDDQRDVIIGGAQYYSPEDIVGKTVIVIQIWSQKKWLELNLTQCCWQQMLMINHFG